MKSRWLLGLVSGLLMGIPTFGAAAAQPHAITVDGLEREYLVYVPDNAHRPASVVFCLHGGGSNARQIERYTQFDALAAKEGFVVIYPESVDGNWNDGRGNPEIRAQRDNIDDVKFLRRAG